VRSGPGKTAKNKKKKKKSTVVRSKKKSTVMSPIRRRMRKRNPSSGQNGQLVHWWLLIQSGLQKDAKHLGGNLNEMPLNWRSLGHKDSNNGGVHTLWVSNTIFIAWQSNATGIALELSPDAVWYWHLHPFVSQQVWFVHEKQ